MVCEAGCESKERQRREENTNANRFPASPSIGSHAPGKLRQGIGIQEDRTHDAKRRLVQVEIRGHKFGDAGIVCPCEVAGCIGQHPENKDHPTICHEKCGNRIIPAFPGLRNLPSREDLT